MIDYDNEFDIRIEHEGRVVERKVKAAFLQLLVDRMGSGILCRKAGTKDRFLSASSYGFMPTKTMNNPAIARRRLQEIFKTLADKTMFEESNPSGDFGCLDNGL